jgi:hypothetical protein
MMKVSLIEIKDGVKTIYIYFNMIKNKNIELNKSYDPTRLVRTEPAPPRLRRAPVREGLVSTGDLRRDSREGRLAGLQNRFRPIIESLSKRAEVRYRLDSDGFLPDLSPWLEMPKAQAAVAVKAGILMANERSKGRPLETVSDRQIRRWRSQIGIEERQGVILLEGAAFREGLLAVPEAYGNKFGVVARLGAYGRAIDHVKGRMRDGQQLIVGETLPDVLKGIYRGPARPTSLLIIQGSGDPLLTAAHIKNLLGDPYWDVEIRTVTPRSLDTWLHSSPSGLAERFEAFRREIALKTAA